MCGSFALKLPTASFFLGARVCNFFARVFTKLLSRVIHIGPIRCAVKWMWTPITLRSLPCNSASTSSRPATHHCSSTVQHHVRRLEEDARVPLSESLAALPEAMSKDVWGKRG